MGSPVNSSFKLTSQQRAYLKALAHKLKPVVQVGNLGWAPSVVQEIKQALHAHQLIKVQLPSQTTASDKEVQTEELEKLGLKGTHVVARLGRVVVLFQEMAEETAKIKLSVL